MATRSGFTGLVCGLGMMLPLGGAAPADGSERAVFPDDPLFSFLWGLDNTGQSGGTPDADIDAPQAWALHTGDGATVVAIVDTGVQAGHPEFQVVPGWNTYSNNANTQDGHGHGTQMAGVAVALGDNGVGGTGVAWNLWLMPMKALSDGAGGSEDTLALAILWAADHGADVIMVPVATHIGSPFLEGAVQYARTQGVLVIASAGADPSQGVGFPAAFDSAVCVGALDDTDHRASFCPTGPELDLMAPGIDILTTGLGGQYVWMSGTSLATAYVAGVAGLVRSYNPALSDGEVATLLEETADDLGPPGPDEQYGWGRVNAWRALCAAVLRGDSNCDGVVDFGDINPFVLALSNPVLYSEFFPTCGLEHSDCNCDGVVDFADINLFVAVMSGGR